jgi:hypothetical protein
LDRRQEAVRLPFGAKPRDTGDGREHLPVEIIFSNGVCLSRAQVRARWGRSLSPLSSMKTMVRRSQSAFFKLWPAHSFPVPDSLLVGLQCSTGEALAAPAKMAQDTPDVSFAIAHPALVFDHLAW